MSYPCAVDGCSRDAPVPRGICSTHARQAEKKRKAEPLIERDPETQAVYDRHPNIKQKPLIEATQIVPRRRRRDEEVEEAAP